MGERIRYFDVAKGIGIIAVIIGHMNIWKFNHIIYSFHMPLFFLVSGYFINNKYSVVEYSKRKARQLLFPYSFTCFVMFALSVATDLIKGKDVHTLFSNLATWVIAALYGSGNIEFGYITKIGAIWFLLAMFFACVFVRSIINRRYSFVYVVIVSLVGYISSLYVWLPLSIQPGMVASFFVYIGYSAKQHRIFQRKNNGFELTILFAIWVLAAFFGSINMAKNYYKILPLSITGAICGTYIILLICRKFDMSGKLKHMFFVLEFYGKNTLVVLCFHLLELTFFPWNAYREITINLGLSNAVIIIIQFTLKMIWVTLAVIAVNRVKPLKRIFYAQEG